MSYSEEYIKNKVTEGLKASHVVRNQQFFHHFFFLPLFNIVPRMMTCRFARNHSRNSCRLVLRFEDKFWNDKLTLGSRIRENAGKTATRLDLLLCHSLEMLRHSSFAQRRGQASYVRRL